MGFFAGYWPLRRDRRGWRSRRQALVGAGVDRWSSTSPQYRPYAGVFIDMRVVIDKFGTVVQSIIGHLIPV